MRLPALLLAGALALSPVLHRTADAAPLFRFQTIGLLAGDFASAQAVSNDGTVVGYAGTSAASGLPRAAVTWSGGALDALPSLGGTRSTALGVNDVGTVVGWSRDAAERTRAAVWQGGAVSALDALPGASGWTMEFAWDVNGAGQAVGVGTLGGRGRGFLADLGAGTVTELQTLGGSRSDAYGINEAGVAVGRSRDAAERTRATLWRDGAATDLGTLGGENAQAWEINDRGQVAGWSQDQTGARRAFLHDGVAMAALASLGGGFDQAYDLNDDGWVVGQARAADGSSRAVLWSGERVFDLNDLVRGASGFVLDFAWGINDRGWIVGNARGADGSLHGFVLTPVPEPATLALLLAGILGLLVLRGRAAAA